LKASTIKKMKTLSPDEIAAQKNAHHHAGLRQIDQLYELKSLGIPLSFMPEIHFFQRT
jgi:hypothetical protein